MYSHGGAIQDDLVTRWARQRMPFLFQTETKETFFRRIATFLSPFDTRYRKIELAYGIAKEEFRGIQRDGGQRYFEHLRDVALILIDYLEIRDHELIIAALLHDILEDIPEWTEVRLINLFGYRTACIIAEATEPKPEECGGSKEAAEREFHARFEVMERDFFLVKLSDRLHNLVTLGARPRDKQITKVAETEEYYLPQARKHLILLPELRELVQLWRRQLA